MLSSANGIVSRTTTGASMSKIRSLINWYKKDIVINIIFTIQIICLLVVLYAAIRQIAYPDPNHRSSTTTWIPVGRSMVPITIYK